LARNETLYREVNERVSELAEQFEAETESPADFICKHCEVAVYRSD